MKKTILLLIFVASLVLVSHKVLAQGITVYLMPGWTWFSYPKAEAIDIADAMGDFVPAEGDIINSQLGSAVYHNGVWRGSLNQFVPSMGYSYYSNREEQVSFVFNESIPQLIVSTVGPTDITATSATIGGSVTTNNNNFVFIMLKGICWATHPNPVVMNDFYTENGNGIESFSAMLTSITPSTTYYVRAFVVTPEGITYGEELSFTTMSGIPEVITGSVASITANSATCRSMVTTDGGLDITSRGVCWSTSPNPTVANPHTSEGTGMGGFVSILRGLSDNTTFYVRAYATNSHGTVYGNEQIFTTLESDGNGNAPTGAINGLFSVNAFQRVYFSQGNLQYIGSASTPYWRFAENQWDVLGDNGQGSTNQNVDRDLFGWGTSGWDNGNTCFHPWDTQKNGSNTQGHGYGPTDGSSYTFDLTGTYANADWGVYNSIVNGGNQPNKWRTLTSEEWNYVFNIRSTVSGIRYVKAKVNNVNGVILLPDDWSVSTYSLSNTNNSAASFNSNIIAVSQWFVMEQAGAVFLPAAGYRFETSVGDVGSFGHYWSSSYCNSFNAYFVLLFNSNLGSQNVSYRFYGRSVRLVCFPE